MKKQRTARHMATALALPVILGTSTLGAPAVAAVPPSRPSSPSPARPATQPGPVVVTALDRAAHPLRTVGPGGDTRDLRPPGEMTGDARVVGLGEATHGSHDFFALKDRVFRHLVTERGLRAFALEASWSTGPRLDDHVTLARAHDVLIHPPTESRRPGCATVRPSACRGTRPGCPASGRPAPPG